MAIITFWSNSKKRIGQTLGVMAAATYMGMDRNFKTLLMTTNEGDTSFEEAFTIQQVAKNKILSEIGAKKKVELDAGVDGLAKLASAGKITPEIITSYTQVVYKQRLEVLFPIKKKPSTEAIPSAVNDEKTTIYKNILTNANQYYDYIFIDLEKGFDEPYIREILRISDVIVVSVEQRQSQIEKLLEFKRKEAVLKANNILTVIERYDRFSKYNVKNIMRQMKSREQIYCIPYSTRLYEAADEHNLADAFLAVRKAKEGTRERMFLDEMSRLIDGIIYKVQELQMNF